MSTHALPVSSGLLQRCSRPCVSTEQQHQRSVEPHGERGRPSPVTPRVHGTGEAAGARKLPLGAGSQRASPASLPRPPRLFGRHVQEGPGLKEERRVV